MRCNRKKERKNDNILVALVVKLDSLHRNVRIKDIYCHTGFVDKIVELRAREKGAREEGALVSSKYSGLYPFCTIIKLHTQGEAFCNNSL